MIDAFLKSIRVYILFSCFAALYLLGTPCSAEHGAVAASTAVPPDSITRRAELLPTTSESALPPLLEHAGKQAALFWQNIPSFTCTESVTQEKLGKKGKAEYRMGSVNNYLALAKSADEDLAIEEVRMPRKLEPDKPDKPALLGTNGFSTMLLIFHPLYRDYYRFEVEPAEPGDKSRRVRFEHIAGTRSISAVRIRDRIYPLDLKGTVWMDPDSGAIMKISARLSAPMKEINIEQFRIDIAYTPWSFPPETEEKWLPSRAVIELQTGLQHWRNTHIYSVCKRFSVESSEEISK
jgi:hypothetical protein